MTYSFLPIEINTGGEVLISQFTCSEVTSNVTLYTLNQTATEEIAAGLCTSNFNFFVETVNMNGYTLKISPQNATSRTPNIDVNIPIMKMTGKSNLGFYFCTTNSTISGIQTPRGMSMVIMDMSNKTFIGQCTFEYDYTFSDMNCYKINSNMSIVAAGTGKIGYMGGVIFTPNYLIQTGTTQGSNTSSYDINQMSFTNGEITTMNIYSARNIMNMLVLEPLFNTFLPHINFDGLYVMIRNNSNLEERQVFTKDGRSYLILGRGAGSNQRSAIVISDEILGADEPETRGSSTDTTRLDSATLSFIPESI